MRKSTRPKHKRGVRYVAGTPTTDTRSDLTKELMRQTRTVAALERRRRDYKRKLLALSKEIRARKRGLRLLVNRKAFVNGEIEFDSAANEKGGGA